MSNKINLVCMDVDLRLLKEGNERVFRQIVRSYECRLNRFAMIYTQNRAVSEEIVSDTFLSLWKNRHSLDENTRLTPYLMVILRNKCINYLRSFRHKFVSIDEMDIGAIYVKAHLYTLENDASKLLEEEDLLLVIRKAMETLPEKTRAIFEMSRIQGLKNKEIADQYGLSVKAIEFHITKALQHLRKKMPKEYLFLLFFLFSSYRH